MSKRIVKKVVTVSDIHIGTKVNNTQYPGVACWFNEKYHAPKLNCVFDYILENQDTIDEVVINGDLFDQWTFAPNVRPPPVLQIINDNPIIFGKGTPLDKVVTAMKGNVSYLNGNHDINVLQDDLDEIPLSNNYKIKWQPNKYMINQTLFTHGHLYTIFNAPPIKRKKPEVTPLVPLGHFVTRLIAHYVSTQNPVVPAWEMTGLGAPSKRDILFSKAFFPALKFVAQVFNPLVKYSFGPKTVSDFLDIWIEVSKFKGNEFKMADGSTITIDEVKKTYQNLFTEWIDKYGEEYVKKSIYTDGAAQSMSWFTQQDALKCGASMVSTGHTHYATCGVNALAGDVNSGFDCVPKGDKEIFSFAEIDDIDSIGGGDHWPKAKIFEIVEKNGVYTPKIDLDVPKGDIVFKPLPGFPFTQPKDYSVYVRIHNTLDEDIELLEHSVSYGNWRVLPPKKISPNSSGGCWVQDSKAGSTGSVSYKASTGNFKLDFSCPWIQSISANKLTLSGPGSSGVNIIPYNKVGDGEWSLLIQPPEGHPLSIDLWVGHY